jgi:drug/metabolite transporter (DMT)-like permease
MFTVFFARLFIGEAIQIVDIINVFLVFSGLTMIVKPAVIFGSSEMYTNDPEAIYAVIALILGSVFLQANVYVLLRMLKGMCIIILKNNCNIDIMV